MRAAEDAFNRRVNQLDRTGTVGIRDFDQGVVTTLGATVHERYNYITVPGVDPADGWPGTPVVFADPEDVFQQARLPFVLVRRDDITPAMERWQPAGVQYRTAGLGAMPVSATLPTGLTAMGFDRMEQLAQAIPYDISYTISVQARHRGSSDIRNQANAILTYLLRYYPPYGLVKVTDSILDIRSYAAFNTGVSTLDNIGEVTERIMGYALSIRVEGELDLKDPVTIQTVKGPLTLRTRQL